MYFSFDSEQLVEKFPIFSTEADCIMDFFSLDMVKDIEFGKALYAFHPEVYDRLFENLFQRKLNRGNILPYRKSNPMIMHIPSKEVYNLPTEEDIIYEGLLKFSQNYKKLNINKVAIQETKFINKVLIDKLILNLDFPEIIYYKRIK